MRHDVVPTGSLALDVATKIGGWPLGHVVEVFGEETVGKSTLALLACRHAQRAGGEAAFLDCDHTFDLAYARSLGVIPARLVLSQPSAGEEAIGVAQALLRSGAVTVLVIDSVAALIPEAERDGSLEDVDAAAHRKLLSRGVKELAKLAAKHNALVICVNRLVQQKGRNGWVEVTAGGTKLPELAALRIRLHAVARSEGTVRVRATVEKNALAERGAADLLLRWGAGVDYTTDLLCAAFDLGVLTADKAGRFWFDGVCLGAIEEARHELLGHAGVRVLAAMRAAGPWAQRSEPREDDAAE